MYFLGLEAVSKQNKRTNHEGPGSGQTHKEEAGITKNGVNPCNNQRHCQSTMTAQKACLSEAQGRQLFTKTEPKGQRCSPPNTYLLKGPRDPQWLEYVLGTEAETSFQKAPALGRGGIYRCRGNEAIIYLNRKLPFYTFVLWFP